VATILPVGQADSALYLVFSDTSAVSDYTHQVILTAHLNQCLHTWSNVLPTQLKWEEWWPMKSKTLITFPPRWFSAQLESGLHNYY